MFVKGDSVAVTKEDMLEYLQVCLNEFLHDKDLYGVGDPYVKDKLHGVIACKEMVEVLIREPVNLGKNGKVTTGF